VSTAWQRKLRGRIENGCSRHLPVRATQAIAPQPPVCIISSSVLPHIQLDVLTFYRMLRTCKLFSELVSNGNSAPLHISGALASTRNGDMWVAADELGETLLAPTFDHLALQATKVALS
jgi:hypothetical protein